MLVRNEGNAMVNSSHIQFLFLIVPLSIIGEVALVNSPVINGKY